MQSFFKVTCILQDAVISDTTVLSDEVTLEVSFILSDAVIADMPVL